VVAISANGRITVALLFRTISADQGGNQRYIMGFLLIFKGI